MNLSKYLKQSEPLSVGEVRLDKSEVRVHGTIEHKEYGTITSVTIITFKYTYYVINKRGVLWTQNEDGTPKSESVFSLAEPLD